MQELIRKIFGIHAGEGIQTFRFIRMAIFWAFGCSCFDTLTDGLFIEKIGTDFLPRIYLVSALGMVCISSLILYSLKKTSPYRILLFSLVLGFFTCLAAAKVTGAAPPLVFWYVLKIASKMILALLVTTSWTFTDQYHDLQDAKRSYPLYVAAYFIGTSSSGLVINQFLDSVGFSLLLCFSALSLLFAMAEARKIAIKGKAVHDDSTEGVFSTSKTSFLSTCKLILQSRFVIAILLFSLAIQLITTITEFNYMEAFGRHFASFPSTTGEEKVTEFLGKCRAIVSFFNIGIGILFYNRFVRNVGLNNAILVSPLFFSFVYTGWVFQDNLSFAILGLIAVEGVLLTFSDNCAHLLLNAVPAKLRSKVRIVNDSFFESIGLLLSSLLLFCFQENSRLLGFALTIFTFGVVLFIRSSYAKSILSNLKENALHFERKLKHWISSMSRREQKDAQKEIVKALRSPREEIQILGAKALLDLADPAMLPEILSMSKRFGTLAKIQFMRLLDATPFNNHPNVIETIDLWVNENTSPELSKYANFYLAKRGLLHPEKAENDLDHPDLFLRGAAILTLKKSLAHQSIQSAALNRTIASKKLDLMLVSDRIDEISMALDILAEENSRESAERCIPFLSHDSSLVQRSAARSVAKLASKDLSRYAPRFVEELEASRDQQFRLSLLETIGKISDSTIIKDLLLASIHFRPSERRKTEEILIQMGLKIVPLLLSLTKDISLPERARILAGKILGRLAPEQLQANLLDILDIEIERAYFYFYFGHTIQKQYPLYDLAMLQHALLSGYQSVIDFTIHLLGAAGSLEDPDLLVRSLHSRNAKIHSHAMESVEKTCDPKLFRWISPLIDDLPLEEKMTACLKWQGNFPKLTLSELLNKLDDSPLLFDKIVAVRLKTKLQMPNWRQELRELMKQSDETLHQYAYELLES